MVRAAALSVCAALAVALSGCVQIVAETPAQQDTIGDVVVATQICVSGSEDPSIECKASQTNSGQSAAVGGDQQLLVAYRIPVGVTAPASVTVALDSPHSGSTTLSRSPSYEAQMQQLKPAPAGFKWIGYISSTITNGSYEPDLTATITARFSLPRGQSGEPYPGPFQYHAMVGARTAGDGHPGNTGPSRPVDCGADPLQKNQSNGEQTICIDSVNITRSPSPTRTQANATFSGSRTVNTKDLGVLSGVTASARPGTSMSIPFTIRSVGMDGSPIFQLSGGTTVPGGTATASRGTFEPQPGDATVAVTVNVPAGTPSGTYEVSLTALLGSSQARTGTATLTVSPDAPPGGDVLNLSFDVRRAPLRRALRTGLKVRVNCSAACDFVATVLRGGSSVGKARGALIRAGEKTVTARFKKGARRRLARKRAVKLKVRVVAADALGNASRKSRAIKLRR